jgi:hypothetical protein
MVAEDFVVVVHTTVLDVGLLVPRPSSSRLAAPLPFVFLLALAGYAESCAVHCHLDCVTNVHLLMDGCWSYSSPLLPHMVDLCMTLLRVMMTDRYC